MDLFGDFADWRLYAVIGSSLLASLFSTLACGLILCRPARAVSSLAIMFSFFSVLILIGKLALQVRQGAPFHLLVNSLTLAIILARDTGFGAMLLPFYKQEQDIFDI